MSLQSMAGHLEGLVLLVKRLDPIEARASLDELTAMIQTSKEKFSQKYGKQTAAKLKEGIIIRNPPPIFLSLSTKIFLKSSRKQVISYHNRLQLDTLAYILLTMQLSGNLLKLLILL